MVLYVFCNAVNFIFRLMDSNLRISCRNTIDLPINLFFFKDWSFSDTYCKLSLSCGLMGGNKLFLKPAFFDHNLEIDIYVFAGGDV